MKAKEVDKITGIAIFNGFTPKDSECGETLKNGIYQVIDWLIEGLNNQLFKLNVQDEHFISDTINQKINELPFLID